MDSPRQIKTLAGRRSIRAEVGRALRAALVSGEMQPDEVYSAPMLAAKFGVSPTPVREAMLDLVNEGLVTTAPNKGFRVRGLSDRELDELTEIRRYLEVPATVKVIGRATPDDLERLSGLAQGVISAARDGDLIAFVEFDRQFHLELLTIGGNSELVSLVDNLRSKARLFGIARLAANGRLVTNAREHIKILEYIEAGDSEGLRALMEHHIDHVRGDNA